MDKYAQAYWRPSKTGWNLVVAILFKNSDLHLCDAIEEQETLQKYSLKFLFLGSRQMMQLTENLESRTLFDWIFFSFYRHEMIFRPCFYQEFSPRLLLEELLDLPLGELLIWEWS